MIVEWVRRDDGALLRHNPRPYSTVIRPPPHEEERLRERPRGECFASFHTPSHLVFLWLFSGRKTYRGVTESVDAVDSERMGGQREREVRFPSESISRQDYQTGADTSPLPPCTIILVSVAVGVLSVKGISYITLTHTRRRTDSIGHTHTHTHTHVYVRSRTGATVSAGDLYFRYASRLEGKGRKMRDKDRPLCCSTFSRQFSARRGERGRCGERREPAEPV